MPRTFRRFNWLTSLFPPAEAEPPQPGSVSGEIAFTHQVLNGTERLAEYIIFQANGALGATGVTGPAVPVGKYWFVIACSGEHNDPIARELSLFIRNPAGVNLGLADGGRAVPTSRPVPVQRSFIMTPRVSIRIEVDAIAAGQVITIRFLYMELDLGEPAPPSP